MHELSITQSILDTAIRHAPDVDNVRITNLYLVIGELSSVVDDSVQFYWDFLADDTIAAGARLHFHRIPALMRCTSCTQEYSPYESLACPRCGSSQVRIVDGEQFYLEAIVVDENCQETVS